MSNAKKCDKCNGYYDENRNQKIDGISARSIKICSSGPYMDFDLCDDCFDALFKFLNLEDGNEKDEEQEKEEPVKLMNPCKPCIISGPCEQCMFGYRTTMKKHK